MASTPESFVLVQPEADTTENVDQLASRLLASRYGELRCLLLALERSTPKISADLDEMKIT